MSRCIIITAYLEGCIKDSINIDKTDSIICADGGYKYAQQENILPDLLIGDLDSFTEEVPQIVKVIKYPVEKDDTDTLLCIKYALENGFDDIVIVGGMGGRMDHTLSNLQSMSFAIDTWHNNNLKGNQISMHDANNHIILLMNDSITLENVVGEKISLISYSEKCTGIFTAGLKWPLSDAVLTNSLPLGVSNEFADTSATVTVTKGKMLVLLSKD